MSLHRHCIGVINSSSIQGVVKVNGIRPCPGWAHKGSDYCFLHDPTVSRQRRSEIAALGGSAGKGKRRLRLSSPGHVYRQLARTLNSLLNKEVPKGDLTSEIAVIRCLISFIRFQCSGKASTTGGTGSRFNA